MHDKKKYQHAGTDTNCQAQNIDEREQFLFPQMFDGNEEIILYHADVFKYQPVVLPNKGNAAVAEF
jgi:hypothetical protein